MDHGRIPWLTPDELSDEQRTLYDSVISSPRSSSPGRSPIADPLGRLHGPFNALLHSPNIGNAVQELGTAVRYGAQLSPRCREIAILEIAKFCRSEFEWYAHATAGLRAGLTEEEIANLDTGSDAPTFSPIEETVRSTVRVLLNERDLSDEQYTTATDALGLQPALDLVVLVGYYQMLALVMAAVRTPLPTADA